MAWPVKEAIVSPSCRPASSGERGSLIRLVSHMATIKPIVPHTLMGGNTFITS